ncbi:MAG: SpoIIE family protein phosphatase [Prevotella sp.]|nr:SpoIIE family protein phosphatase [Prevotella sp.]
MGKKEKSPYPRSFAKRLTWRIMLRMFLVMIIPVFLLFWLTYALVAVGVMGISERVLKGEKEEVRRIASDLYMAATNTAPFIEEDLDKPDRMYELMNRMLKLNPYMRSCGIYFVEGYYPQKGRLFAPYASRNDSIILESQDACDQGNDYVNAEWFKQAISSDNGYWAKPFFDNDSVQSPLVSYLLPIRDKQQRTVAVLGVDLSLSWLNEKIQLMRVSRRDPSKEWDASYQIYYYMTDSTGTLLVHPDTKRLVKENIQPYITNSPDNHDGHMTVNDSREEEMVIDGEEVQVCSQVVKYTDWVISFVVPTFYIRLFGYSVAGIAIMFILIGMLVVYFFGRRTIKRDVKPLKQLATTANEVAKGNFQTTLPPLKSHDEIHKLRDSFEQMQRSLVNYTAQLRATTAQKASMESELKIAHDIQMSMLPKTFPPYPERHDIDIYGSLKPAKAVGGDLFDFYIRDEKLFFCIGDVSGKGVPASLFMAVTRSLFRNISAHVAIPSEVVRTLNNAMSEGNDTNMFVTVFVGVLDLTNGLLRYCNAGHDAPLLVGRDVGVLSCQPNLPIGVVAGFEYTQQEVSIDSGTTIFLFTDGLNEAENYEHAQFGDLRIWNLAKLLLNEQRHQPKRMIDAMANAVHTFVGDAEQSDDLTMLAIQYKK